MTVTKIIAVPKRICGVDEVGRGPLAGPVVAAAVILPADYKNSKIQDSKKLSAAKRDILDNEIKEVALAWSIVSVGHKRIDEINILQASLLAMKIAVLKVNPDFVRVDGNKLLDIDIPQEAIIGGDDKFQEISAASIIAKVWRDKLMQILAKKYPGYGLEKHAGYPTASHRNAISIMGPSRVHRTSFKGVKEYLNFSPISPSFSTTSESQTQIF